MALSDTAIKNLKPSETDYTKYDGRGLSILVRPTGAKLWRFKYRFNAKGNLLSLGKYPDVPLHLARKRREEARSAPADGIDPSAKRKADATSKKNADDVPRHGGRVVMGDASRWPGARTSGVANVPCVAFFVMRCRGHSHAQA